MKKKKKKMMMKMKMMKIIIIMLLNPIINPLPKAAKESYINQNKRK